jgi:hypothetical protein
MEHGTDTTLIPQNNLRSSDLRIVTPCELSFISKDQHQPIVRLPKLPKARPKKITRGLTVALKFRKKKIKSTTGINRQPKNHHKLRL